jgi:hypothetical protein
VNKDLTGRCHFDMMLNISGASPGGAPQIIYQWRTAEGCTTDIEQHMTK